MPNLLSCYEDINCQVLGLAHGTCSESRNAEWHKGKACLAIQPDSLVLNLTPHLHTV